MKRLSKIKAAYLAGLIDGEGTIFVSRVKANSHGSRSGFNYRSGLSIAITNLSIVEWCQQVTGCGKIRFQKRANKKHKPSWRWALWSDQASEFLKQILPFLRVKRLQASNLISFQQKMTWYGSGGASLTEMKRREVHRQISLRLNKRGL